MSILPVNSAYTQPPAMPVAAPKADASAEANANQNQAALLEAAATFERGETAPVPKVYSKGDGKIQSAIVESDRKIAAFQQLLGKYFTQQGKAANLSDSANVKKAVMERIKGATSEDIAAAKAQIGEGGYYSEKETADRIVSMAKSLAGNDPSKIAQVRKGVENGFKSAEKAWGDKLPSICKDTYDNVMRQLDDWEGSIAKSATKTAE